MHFTADTADWNDPRSEIFGYIFSQFVSFSPTKIWNFKICLHTCAYCPDHSSTTGYHDFWGGEDSNILSSKIVHF